MHRIGLTGGIGSGKTTVSDYFKSIYNIPVIDADEISRQLMTPHGGAYNEVVDLFGSTSVLKSGEIDRKYIRDQIFQTPELRTALEQIIHPKVKISITEETKKLTSVYCLIVIPLLIESNMQSMVDRILLIQTDKQLQIARVTLRDKCGPEHVEAIIASQLSTSEKINYADDIIVNNGPEESLIPQIEQLHQKYMALGK